MRFRTFARIRTVHRARRTILPASLAVAVLAVAGMAVGATSAMAATAPPQARTTVVAPVAATERPVDHDAAFYVSVARAVQKSAAGKVDTAPLTQQIEALDDSSTLPERSVRVLTRLVQESSTKITAAVADYDAQAAAKAAADAAAAAQAAADALAQANTPDGARATARAMAASQYGWGDGEFSCLDSLWQKESGWNYQAYNGDGGATGIPQALPGSKMASFGSDWETNATTQVAWGLDYISRGYGSPCSAWGHSQSVNWY
ncbi:phospholipase [uncultured Microbacterium sp.]|uniref:aggregation-promoting factor C-terminal-like domain-containing protein n=1 Tax=uncultured Microbacterium sp. TaxID=191216 RepID=UPI0035CC83CD